MRRVNLSTPRVCILAVALVVSACAASTGQAPLAPLAESIMPHPNLDCGGPGDGQFVAGDMNLMESPICALGDVESCMANQPISRI